MPGMVAFRRKWNIGSDDLIVPALIMFIMHSFWTIVLILSLAIVPVEAKSALCVINVQGYAAGFIVILAICAGTELSVICVGMRGTIVHTEPRAGMRYLIYARLGLMVVELFWLVLGIVWIVINANVCADLVRLKGILSGAVVCDWLLLAVILSSAWYIVLNSSACISSDNCCMSSQPRTTSASVTTEKSHKVVNDSVDGGSQAVLTHHRPMVYFSSSTLHSLITASQIFAGLFSNLELLTTDVFAGLLLLRQKQKSRQASILSQGTSEVYEFLSGVAITPATCFLSLRLAEVLHNYKKTVHFMSYVLATHSVTHQKCKCVSTAIRQADGIFTAKSGTSSSSSSSSPADVTMNVDDGGKLPHVICHKQLSDREQMSFTVSVDHTFKAVVINVSAELALQVMVESLRVDVEVLPLDPTREDWLVHKELLQAALEIKSVIEDEQLLTAAFSSDPEKGTARYSLVLVGHSIGAGIAAILSILLRSIYPTVHCYAYSPPGSLMSATCAEETKAFITSVVVGKDVFPRIGLNQLETFRQDLMNAIKKSTEPKWKIIAGAMLSCSDDKKASESVYSTTATAVEVRTRARHLADCHMGRFCRNGGSPMLLALHTPMYPPGRILHIVRSHPKDLRQFCCHRKQVIYQAVWAENADFDQILVSPTMISDHMPDLMFDAMKKVLTRISPMKPSRKPVKPTHELLIGPSEASQFTNDELAETACVSTSAHCATFAAPVDPNCSIVGPLDSSWHADVVVKRHGICLAERSQRARSFPPSVPPGTMIDDWLGLAPLATPETLSESSSLASYGSGNVVYQRVTSTVLPRMDPILQSPARSANSRDCCLYLESADIVGDLATLSPCVEQLPMPLSPHRSFGCEPDIVPAALTKLPNSELVCAETCKNMQRNSAIAASEHPQSLSSSSPDVVQQSLSVGHDQSSPPSERGVSLCFHQLNHPALQNAVTKVISTPDGFVCHCSQEEEPVTISELNMPPSIAQPDVILTHRDISVQESVDSDRSVELASCSLVDHWESPVVSEHF